MAPGTRGKAGAKETFLAIDGTALAYRSHFAFINRPLTTKKGEVTSAVFGFILGLRKILDTLAPDAVVVVFDPPGPTFRHELFADYKATRERMPDDLRQQLPWLDRYLDAVGIPRVSVPGYEADDVMATLAKRAVEAGMRSRIVSNDKDLMQMVEGDLAVVTLGKASEPPRLMEREGVHESFGVNPEQIVDFLTLTGDSSDNVPGVPGIGKKTAAKLLAEHGTLEAILEAAPGMKASRMKENLLASRDLVEQSRRLVTLVTDVEVDEPATYRPRESDADALNELFDELEFHSMKVEAPTVQPSDTSGYVCADDTAAVKRMAKELERAGSFAFDTETTGVDPMRADLVGLSFCAAEGKAWYVPVAHENGRSIPWDEARAILKPLLENPAIAKCAQNAKYDLLVLRRHGVDVAGVDFDTMIASYVLDPSRRSHGLDDLARDRLDVEVIPLKSLIGSGKSQILISQAPLADVVDYAAEDADVTWRLRRALEPELDASDLRAIFADVEMPLVGVLADMEEAGVRLDVPFLVKLSKRMEKELAEVQAAAWKAAGEEFNLASPKQIAELLFGKLGLRSRRRTKTGQSTNAEVLAELSSEHEVPALILRHRKIAKLKSTYVDALPTMVNPATGKIHTSFGQAVAATGRLSSSDPNLQNVPVRTWEGREIRKAFVPSEPGRVLVSCDYSQIELRILAHMALDEPLLEAFRDDRDVHRATAALVFDVPEAEVTDEQRASAKTINFGVIYGMGAVNLGRSLGISTREASRFIDAYFERYPGVRRFIDTTQEEARSSLVVKTLLGRRRPIPEIASADHRTRAFGERIAVNTPIQGTAADILKIAMIRVAAALESGPHRARMILTVHDELVFDCPAEEREELVALVTREMEGAMDLEVPLRVDSGWGPDWAEAH